MLISQDSLAEITNQRLSLKYQTFRQLPAAFISGTTGEGNRKLPKRLIFQRKSLVGDFRKRTLSDTIQPDNLLLLSFHYVLCTKNVVYPIRMHALHIITLKHCHIVAIDMTLLQLPKSLSST